MLDETHRPLVAQQDGADEEVVAEVFLAGAAGDRHRDALDVPTAAADRGYEPCDPAEAPEARLVRVVAAPEEAARLEEEAAEDPGPRPVRVQRGEGAEAGAHQNGAALDRPEERQPIVDEPARVAGRSRVALVAVRSGRQERRAERRQLAEGHEVVE